MFSCRATLGPRPVGRISYVPVVTFISLIAIAVAMLFGPASDAEALSVKRLTASVNACPGQNDSSARPAAQSRVMRCMFNFAREKRGLSRLKSSSQLDRSARRKSGDIKRCGSFDHYACGRDFTFWMRQVGYARQCWTAAENIAWGKGKNGNVRSIFVAWLKSPGHRANILSRNYSAVGAGVRKGRFFGNRGSQVWTTHFGSHC